MAEVREDRLIGDPDEEPFFALQPAQRRSTARILLVAGLILALGSAPLAGSGWFLSALLGCMAAGALAATVIARRTAGVACLVAAVIFGLLTVGNVLRSGPDDEVSVQEQPAQQLPAVPSPTPPPTTSSPTASPTPSPVPEKVLKETRVTLKPRGHETPFDGLHVFADDWTGGLILRTRDADCSFQSLPEKVEQAYVLPSVKEDTWYRVTIKDVEAQSSWTIRSFTVLVELVRAEAAPTGTLLSDC